MMKSKRRLARALQVCGVEDMRHYLSSSLPAGDEAAGEQRQLFCPDTPPGWRR